MMEYHAFKAQLDVHESEMNSDQRPEDNIRLKNFFEYVQCCPAELESLYEHPSICMFVFRKLRTSTSNLIERLLFCVDGVPEQTINSWQSDALDSKEWEQEKQLLMNLKIWRSISKDDGLQTLVLMPTFAKNLKAALDGDGEKYLFSVASSESKARDVTFLEDYAMTRWLGISYFLSRTNMKAINTATVQTLQKMKLIDIKPDGSIENTKLGYQFLFQDIQSQVRYFMFGYLDSCPERGLSLQKCLSFLCELSSATLGNEYNSEKFSKDMLGILGHLREFGLVYQRQRKDGRFYPTRLATYFYMAGPPILKTELQNDDISLKNGYIFVECNYRIYAYTNVDLQIAILALFCSIQYRFPNMIVAEITSESLSKAFALGITSENILGYLQDNAHPEMYKSKKEKNKPSLIPPAIIGYIKLCENEVKSRVCGGM